jgi:quercetin dioxygenase-like cupin family protein
MRRLLALAMVGALLTTALVTGLVQATPAAGVTSTTIATGHLPQINLLVKNGDWLAQLRTKEDSTLTVVENDVAPGGSFGWHSHPGPSLIIVKSGTLTFYDSSDPTCSPIVHSAGEAFLDPGTDVHIGINNGTTTAVVIVTRLLPVGAPSRIDENAPAQCGF